MKYTIKAPSEAYSRKVCGVQFIDGVAQTEDEWAAQWFSGRSGFLVESKGGKPKGGEKPNGDTGDNQDPAGK